MDIRLARTFLTIVEAGNFVRASHRLHVTQSTISARMQALEQDLGRPLFVRSNAACELTPAGRRFLRHARNLLMVWEEARHRVAVPDRYTESLAVGGQPSLWNGFLLDWLPEFRSARPQAALRLSAGMPARLIAELQDGVHDLIVIHTPELRPTMQVEELFEDRLVLVTTDPGGEYRSRYVYLDWGESFRAMHASEYADLHNPGLSLELGQIGLDVLVATGSAGYVPERIAQPLLDAGALTRIPGAPEFVYPAFAAFLREQASHAALNGALEILRKFARRTRRELG